MASTLPDARQLSDDVLEALRLRALSGRELGFTEADLANRLGVSQETVCRWWAAYTARGLDALPHERTGRPWARAGSCRTRKAVTSNGSWTRRAPRTWASPPRVGAVGLCAT